MNIRRLFFELNLISSGDLMVWLAFRSAHLWHVIRRHGQVACCTKCILHLTLAALSRGRPPAPVALIASEDAGHRPYGGHDANHPRPRLGNVFPVPEVIYT